MVLGTLKRHALKRPPTVEELEKMIATFSHLFKVRIHSLHYWDRSMKHWIAFPRIGRRYRVLNKCFRIAGMNKFGWHYLYIFRHNMAIVA